MSPAHAFSCMQQCTASPHVQEDEDQEHVQTEERIAKAAEAATRSSAAALLKQQQQHIPVKEDYFLPDDEQADGRLAASCRNLYSAVAFSITAHFIWIIQLQSLV